MPVLREFLTGFIDYAGLFPPAGLEMREAVRNYAEYRNGPDREFLGRFVLPASRMEEFASAADGLLEKGDGSVPWCLSVLVDGDVAFARKAMLIFTAGHMSDSPAGHALCEAVEVRAVDAEQVTAVAKTFSRPLRLFFEVPANRGLDGTLDVIARSRGAAKIRTGGVKAEAFPSAEAIVRFVSACNRSCVPFKATAGLHHAACGRYPLTYEANSDAAHMFGYLNLLLAAAFIRKGISQSEARLVLESDLDAFSFRDSGVKWGEEELSRDDLRMTRSQSFLSFGSCSFREPVDEARSLGLI